jgi:hypothetical protein
MQMPKDFRMDKVAVHRLLGDIRDAVQEKDRDLVDELREELSDLAQLDAGRDDRQTSAIRKVFDLTGRWDRGASPHVKEQEIFDAVDGTINLVK